MQSFGVSGLPGGALRPSSSGELSGDDAAARRGAAPVLYIVGPSGVPTAAQPLRAGPPRRGDEMELPVLPLVVAGPPIPAAAVAGFSHLLPGPSFAPHVAGGQMAHSVGSVVSGTSVSSIGMRASSGQGMEEANAQDGTGEAYVEVYSPDFTSLIYLRPSSILHQPPSDSVSRLVLCQKFVPGRTSSCRKGNTCRFVHAIVTGAPRSSVHVNYAWKSAERCTYPRLLPGEVLVVLEPNERQPSERIPSERILVTQGSLNYKTHVGLLSHCAHYYFNRLCKRGENCNFIHAVHVDPNVTVDFRRAPAPAPVVSSYRRSSRSKKTTSGGDTTRKTSIVGAFNGAARRAESSLSSVSIDPSCVNFGDLSGHNLGLTAAPANSALFLDVPRNTSASSSQIGDGSSCGRSTASGLSQVLEWSLVEQLNFSSWTEGTDTSTM